MVEEIKSAILDYLEEAANRGDLDVRHFTKEGIAEALPQHDPAFVEKALSEMEENDWLNSSLISIKIYVPDNDNGKRVIGRFAKAGFLTTSPFMGVLLALVVTYAVISAAPASVPVPSQFADSTTPYIEGYLSGIVGAAFFGLLGGFFVHTGLNKLRRWKVLSEQSYQAIVNMVFWSIFTPLVMVGVYYYATHATGLPVNEGVAIAIGTATLAIVLAIFQLLNRFQSSKEE